MKVLTQGRPQQGWSTEAYCTGEGNGNGGCGALLLVEQGDIFRTESHARDETTIYLTFRCPECRVLTDLASNINRHHVPSHVWDAAPGGVKHHDGGYCHPNAPGRVPSPTSL